MTDLPIQDPGVQDLGSIEQDPGDLLDLDAAVLADEDRSQPERPCGDPAAHDRLLAALRRIHPGGHENAPGPAGRLPRWRASRLEVSLTGCSASLCADAA